MTDREYLEKYLETSSLEEGIKRLKKGEAVQYIIGNVDFYGNIFMVNKDVLIPRFETELLVQKTYNYIRSFFDKKVKILDIGTGSGVIAITLKKLLNSDVCGLDISSSAIDVAKYNAESNDVDVEFLVSDLFSNVNAKYDVIISNPPYISYDEKIDDVVLNNEPALALFASNNGLEFYERVLKDAKNYLNNRALIAFEIGKDQGEHIKKIALKYFPSSSVKIEKDFSSRDRYVFIFVD